MDPDIQDATAEQTAQNSVVPTDTKKNTLYKEILLESLVVVIIIAAILGIFSYLKIVSLPTVFTSANTRTLPLDPSNKEIVGAVINYSIVSKITSVSQTSTGTVISLTKGKHPYPSFTITSQTRITKLKSNISSEELRKALHSGEQVSLAVQYDMQSKKWKTVQLFLYD